MRLILDTALDACQAVLADADGRLLFARSEALTRGHAERLMPLVEELLDAAGTGYDALDSLAVTIGPGSFTGLRVGLAAARGLSVALGLPLAGFTSLAARAAEYSATPVDIAFDARNARVYHQAFDAEGNPQDGPSVDDVALAAARLGAGPGLVTGSGGEALAAAATTLGKAWRFDGNSRDAAQPEALARAGATARPGTTPPAPLYLKPADAIAAKPSGLVAP